MDINQSLIGLFLATDVMDQFVKELYTLGLIPTHEVVRDDDGVAQAEIWLQSPEFLLHQPDAEAPFTVLRLQGELKLDPEADPDAELHVFDVRLRMELLPLERPGEAPGLEMAYGGLADFDNLIAAVALDQAFRSDLLGSALEGGGLDLFTPLIDALSSALYPEDAAPGPDTWPVATRAFAGGGDTVDAIGFFVADVGASPEPPTGTSPLAQNTELALLYARDLLDPLFAEEAAAKVGTEVDEAEITAFTMKMAETALDLSGKAKKDGATIEFDGPVRLSLALGTTDIRVDTSDVDVDVNLAWYQYLGLAVAGLLLFVPFVNVIVGGLLFSKLNEIGSAEGEVQAGLGAGLDEALDKLAQGLGLEMDEGTLSVMSTPSHCTIEDHQLRLFAQVFVSQLSERVTDANHSRSDDRFVGYTLQSGRAFSTSELVRLIDGGKVAVPDHHTVDGRFLRSNPNDRESDNLDERFEP